MWRCQPYDDESRRGPVELRLKGAKDDAGRGQLLVSHLSLMAKEQEQEEKQKNK